MVQVFQCFKGAKTRPQLQHLNKKFLPFSFYELVPRPWHRAVSLQTVSIISIHGPLFYKVQRATNAA